MPDVLNGFDLDRFAERLGQVMQEKSLTQGQLAALSGLTQSAISKYLNKLRKPDADALVRLAVALECSVDWLVGIQDDVQYKRTAEAASVQLHVPAGSNGPVTTKERKTLEKVLRVLRAPDQQGGAGQALLHSIEMAHQNVSMRAELEAEGVRQAGQGANLAKQRKRR